MRLDMPARKSQNLTVELTLSFQRQRQILVMTTAADQGLETPPPSEEIVTPPPSAPLDEPFGREEIKEFSSDDVEAGQAITKMLSLFFLYTVIVMGLSTYVTYRWVFGG